jgi:hypothetical protein
MKQISIIPLKLQAIDRKEFVLCKNDVQNDCPLRPAVLSPSLRSSWGRAAPSADPPAAMLTRDAFNGRVAASKAGPLHSGE